MQPLNGAQNPTHRADPAPSRWAYRFHRLWLTPVFRRALRVGVPFTLAFLGGSIWLSDEARRDAIVLAAADFRAQIHSRPEFMVGLMAVDGAGEGVNEDIREIVPIDFPISSFDLDLETIRADVVGLPAVKEASVRIRDGGVLQIDVTERVPVVVWRGPGGLELVDMEGEAVADVAARTVRPDLPLVAGRGAKTRLDEAMALFRAAAPLSGRMRGLVRMGQRRWDVVLDRGQRIMLPETRPVQALERVIALSEAQDMLARDLVAVDMRLAERPTIRMNTGAIENWWKIRGISVGNNGQ